MVENSLFRLESQFDGGLLKDRFSRLFCLVINKQETTKEILKLNEAYGMGEYEKSQN